MRGTRIPVTTIAGLLAENVSVADVLDSYPTLTIDDLRACQEYAAARDEQEQHEP